MFVKFKLLDMNMKTKLFIFLFSLILSSCSLNSKQLNAKSYGNENGNKGRVLITYATRAGSTIEVADTIAFAIAKQGYLVDVMHIENVQSISNYSAVVIGSAIRMGNVTPEVRKFVEIHTIELQAIPTAYFITCLTLKDDTPENREAVKAYLAPLHEIVEPFAEGYFAGKMDYSKLKPFSRFMAKRVVKAPEGDFRDWAEIRNWGSELF
jgi:menaquinone-dependent protoporphyrinogen oxidase